MSFHKETPKLLTNNISYSLIKNFIEVGPICLIESQYKENVGMSFGTLFDDFLFDLTFNDKYKVINKIPSDTIIGLLKHLKVNYKDLYQKIKNNSLDETEWVVLNEIRLNLDIYKISKKVETFQKYLDLNLIFEYINTDLKVLDVKTHDNLVRGRTTFINNSETGLILNPTNNIESLHQVSYKFPFLDETVRVIFDAIVIDHNDKIIKPYDLKTGSTDIDKFDDAYIHFMYFIQDCLYNLALQHLVITDKQYEGYTIEPMKFIYFNRFNMDYLKIYQPDKTWFYKTIEGFDKYGINFRGIKRIIEDIKWHKQNEKYYFKREYYEEEIIKIKFD